MAKSVNTKSKRQVVKEQITRSLDESQAKFKEEYERSLLEHNPSKVDGSDPATEVTTEVPKIEEAQKPIITYKEEKTMARVLNFEDDQKVADFGEGAKNESKPISDELPDIQDDASNTEIKANEEKSEGSDTATTGKYEDDLSALAEQNIRNFTNIQAEASKVAQLLKQNLLIKQFVTNGTFGRGFVLGTQADGKNGKTAHYKIENIKPGRAKSVVVTVPRKLQEVLAASAKKSVKSLRTQILDATNDGVLTPEEKADTVDMVIGYDDLMARIANLCEGQVAEFGGKGGVLDTAANVKYTKKVDPVTGVESYNETDVSANQVIDIVGGKSHVFYTMAQPSSALMAKAISGEALGDKDKKAIKRFREGKTPLKRTKGAFSALYTEKNFVSTVKYEEVAPFGAQLTKEQAVRLSAKANFKHANHDASVAPIESYDSAMFASNDGIAAVFNPTVPADKRMETMQVAKNYQPKNADGTVKTRKVPKTDANGKIVVDAEGKRIYEVVEEKARDIQLSDRTLKNFYTGKPLTAEEAKTAMFVTYGEPGVTKQNKPTAPRVQKKRIAFDGLETEVNASRGIVGTFGLDDSSVAAFVQMVGQDIAKEAFVKAVSRNSRGGDNTSASEYEEGLLAALLDNASV